MQLALEIDVPARFIPPTLAEVKLTAAKAGLPDLEAEKFYCHYESIGWKVGKNPMKKWVMALTGWKLRWQEQAAKSNGQQSIFNLKTILEAKERLSVEIRQRHAFESPHGLAWDNPVAKERYLILRKEIKELTRRIAESA